MPGGLAIYSASYYDDPSRFRDELKPPPHASTIESLRNPGYQAVSRVQPMSILVLSPCRSWVFSQCSELFWPTAWSECDRILIRGCQLAEI